MGDERVKRKEEDFFGLKRLMMFVLLYFSTFSCVFLSSVLYPEAGLIFSYGYDIIEADISCD